MALIQLSVDFTQMEMKMKHQFWAFPLVFLSYQLHFQSYCNVFYSSGTV